MQHPQVGNRPCLADSSASPSEPLRTAPRRPSTLADHGTAPGRPSTCMVASGPTTTFTCDRLCPPSPCQLESPVVAPALPGSHQRCPCLPTATSLRPPPSSLLMAMTAIRTSQSRHTPRSTQLPLHPSFRHHLLLFAPLFPPLVPLSFHLWHCTRGEKIKDRK